MNNKTRVPLVHISRRAALPWYKAWAIRAAAIVLALIVCGVITALLTGENPFALYASMFDGAFGTSRRDLGRSCRASRYCSASPWPSRPRSRCAFGTSAARAR